MKIVSSRPTITRKELEGVLDCLINDELQTGTCVKEFESALARLVGLQYSLVTSSLTSAYQLVFKSLGIGNGDEVILPDYTHPAPLAALDSAGAKPVLVDCEENSLFPSAESIKKLIGEKTRAVVIFHIFGYHFPREALAEAGIPVIEDISHAIGTEINDVPAGGEAAFTVASFSSSMIITTGNGGMVLTNNSRNYSSMKENRGGDDGHPGLDCGMTDFQAAMGISQISKLQNFLARRREIAKIYHEALRITPHKSIVPFSDRFAYQSFPILFDASNEKVEKYWRKCGIEIYQPVRGLHNFLGLKREDFPISGRLSKKLYSLPIYPTLTKKDIEGIAKNLSKFV
ncbi:MAG: aminotransferase class I/II-fold pyridoxal phosphate-dependent enzyme [Spirochaetes bacterium]|jgi:dTDP-4-amino-4,6-dideoxygalactose transaminase|nr:aminotransferase class I/II-fold pyridoxal phosphate-dependent enzyme [Spirochaetota bacterium]